MQKEVNWRVTLDMPLRDAAGVLVVDLFMIDFIMLPQSRRSVSLKPCSFLLLQAAYPILKHRLRRSFSVLFLGVFAHNHKPSLDFVPTTTHSCLFPPSGLLGRYTFQIVGKPSREADTHQQSKAVILRPLCASLTGILVAGVNQSASGISALLVTIVLQNHFLAVSRSLGTMTALNPFVTFVMLSRV
ncbi:hypothetical protein R3P38DRAFT_983869 [Favolaschia claudopus]|uniref:Uncharacterized protein n=1 Tax=Favolaschia claudopus TaxID=2862362 RepID=A0AAW0BK89_9AGAR